MKLFGFSPGMGARSLDWGLCWHVRRTSIGALGVNLGLTAIVIAVAIAGKVGGAFRGDRITGFDVRNSLALGCLLNTRGLVELIVLNVGLDLGLLSPALFSMMVIMALVTTMITTPVVLPEEYRRTALKVF